MLTFLFTMVLGAFAGIGFGWFADTQSFAALAFTSSCLLAAGYVWGCYVTAGMRGDK